MPEGIRTPDPRLRRPLLYPAELQTHLSVHTEKRVMGIEPTYLAWKASVLPLNYTRKYRGDRIRTCDPLVPNQVLYQAELFPVKCTQKESNLQPSDS